MDVTTTAFKTVLDLDLVGYSSIARPLDENLGPKSVLELNDQVKLIVDKALAYIGLTRANTVISNAGDGAILWFDRPDDAYRFSVAIHDAAHTWSSQRTDPAAMRIFRIGVATGRIEVRQQSGELEVGGYVVSRSVRLQAKAGPASILIDEATYNALEYSYRLAFKGPESVAGKRDEVFQAYCCVCHEVEPKTSLLYTPNVGILGATRGIGGELDLRKNILRSFHSLRPHQYEDLVFLLNIPFDRRPPRLLPLVERRGIILEWIEEEEGGIAFLLDCLSLVQDGASGTNGSPASKQ